MDYPGSPKKKKQQFIPFILTFLIMACFWILFSGRFDLFHLFLGGIACTIVSLTSSRLLFPKPIPGRMAVWWIRFIAYFPWLFKEIFVANLHLLYLTFHPKMMTLINPKVIRFDSRLKSSVSRTTLANSITLTPGTITIFAGVMGSFAVHCIDDKSGQDLPGKMEERVADIFDE